MLPYLEAKLDDSLDGWCRNAV